MLKASIPIATLSPFRLGKRPHLSLVAHLLSQSGKPQTFLVPGFLPYELGWGTGQKRPHTSQRTLAPGLTMRSLSPARGG